MEKKLVSTSSRKKLKLAHNWPKAFREVARDGQARPSAGGEGRRGKK